MSVSVKDTNLEGELMLKQVLIKHVLESNSCRGTFTITCKVGLLNFTLGDGQLNLCKGSLILFLVKKKFSEIRYISFMIFANNQRTLHCILILQHLYNTRPAPVD